jgi:hypothetical protein
MRDQVYGMPLGGNMSDPISNFNIDLKSLEESDRNGLDKL